MHIKKNGHSSIIEAFLGEGHAYLGVPEFDKTCVYSVCNSIMSSKIDQIVIKSSQPHLDILKQQKNYELFFINNSIVSF